MTVVAVQGPFDGNPTEVRLGAAPLIRVLVQVRHAALSVLMGDHGKKTALRFAERLADDYPILQEGREAELIVTAQGVVPREGGTVTWRLKSADEAWQVSVNPEFVALDTTQYAGRGDFLRRLDHVLQCYADIIAPPRVQRIGMRFTNRIDDPQLLERLPELVRPEVLGPSAARSQHATIVHAFTQAQYSIGEYGLNASWGLLPPNAVIDTTLTPTPRQSWTLDMDAFAANRREFTLDKLTEDFRELSILAYRYFRWAVTDKFLEEFREAR